MTGRSRKLPSGTTARAVLEWIGATPDTPPPKRVKLRIVLRQGGKCAVTGKKFGPKATPRFDHIIAQADGGENRESNLQAILEDGAHKPKTAQEATARAHVRARQQTNIGIKDQPKRALQSRNDLSRPKTESKISESGRIERLPLPPRTGGIRFRDKP